MDFYRSMIQVNSGSIQANVGGVAFHLRAQYIAEYLDVPKRGETYFDIFKITSLLEAYLSKDHMTNVIFKPGVILKIPVNLGNLTKTVFVFGKW